MRGKWAKRKQCAAINCSNYQLLINLLTNTIAADGFDLYYFFQLNVCTWYMTEITETSQ